MILITLSIITLSNATQINDTMLYHSEWWQSVIPLIIMILSYNTQHRCTQLYHSELWHSVIPLSITTLEIGTVSIMTLSYTTQQNDTMHRYNWTRHKSASHIYIQQMTLNITTVQYNDSQHNISKMGIKLIIKMRHHNIMTLTIPTLIIMTLVVKMQHPI